MSHRAVVPIRTLSAGAVAGAVILGLAGRAATAAVAAVAGLATNLSLRGMLEAVAVGTVVGIAGAGILLALRAVGSRPGPGAGVALGLVLFAASFVLGWFRARIAFGTDGVLTATLIVVAAVYVVYGLALSAAVSRLDPPADARPTDGRVTIPARGRITRGKERGEG